MSDIQLKRDLLDLQRRMRDQEAKSAGPTLGEFYGQFQGLPGLRGLWYPGSQDNAGAMYDRSGQGRTLTYNGNPTLNLYNSLVPYEDFDGTGDFHSRASEAGLNITGTETVIATTQRGLTLGGWYYISVFGSGSRGLLGKYDAGVQKSYLLFTSSAGAGWSFLVSVDGTNDTIKTSTVAPTAGAWHFVVGRFTPSTEMLVYVDGVQTVFTSAIPASIFSGTAAFNMMAFNAANVAQGRVAVNFLCAALLPNAQLDYLYNRSRVLLGV